MDFRELDILAIISNHIFSFTGIRISMTPADKRGMHVIHINKKLHAAQILWKLQNIFVHLMIFFYTETVKVCEIHPQLFDP